jgi:acyl-coenzyme A synthetase/AMP-(fatty) acid ligase
MVPHSIVEVPNLPRNPNGKIDRKTLAEVHAGALLQGSR